MISPTERKTTIKLTIIYVKSIKYVEYLHKSLTELAEKKKQLLLNFAAQYDENMKKEKKSCTRGSEKAPKILNKSMNQCLN